MDGDGGAERPGRREQRGGGIGAAFDALREAKAVAEVRYSAAMAWGWVSCRPWRRMACGNTHIERSTYAMLYGRHCCCSSPVLCEAARCH